jgi:anti-sigma-K factor RskA
MKEFWSQATQAWSPYVLLAAMAVYVLAKGIRMSRRKRQTPPPEVIDEDLIERLNTGRTSE